VRAPRLPSSVVVSVHTTSRSCSPPRQLPSTLHPTPFPSTMHTHTYDRPTRYADKEVQKDKKLVSYDITDKGGKPYVKVQVAGEDKVSGGPPSWCAAVWVPRGWGGTRQQHLCTPARFLPASFCKATQQHPSAQASGVCARVSRLTLLLAAVLSLPPHSCTPGLLPRGDQRHDSAEDEGRG
jgi:hypothetical protein